MATSPPLRSSLCVCLCHALATTLPSGAFSWRGWRLPGSILLFTGLCERDAAKCLRPPTNVALRVRFRPSTSHRRHRYQARASDERRCLFDAAASLLARRAANIFVVDGSCCGDLRTVHDILNAGATISFSDKRCANAVRGSNRRRDKTALPDVPVTRVACYHLRVAHCFLPHFITFGCVGRAGYALYRDCCLGFCAVGVAFAVKT